MELNIRKKLSVAIVGAGMGGIVFDQQDESATNHEGPPSRVEEMVK